MDHGAESLSLDPEIRLSLDDFADAVGSLTAGDCTRLLAFWKTTDPELRGAAHASAQAAAERTGRRDVIRALQDDLVDWAGGATKGRTGWGERWFDPGGDPMDDGGRAREDAVPPLADAALALALQDVLEDADFDVLYDPWLDAIGDGEQVAAGDEATRDRPAGDDAPGSHQDS